MRATLRVRNQRGIALVTVLLVAFAVSAIAFAGSMWMLNAQIIQKNGDRAAVLNDLAVAALEEGRSRLSSTPNLYPAVGFATLDDSVVVRDASGAIIPGMRRWVWAGPNGVTSGQYGVFGTIMSRVKDQHGNEAVRRMQVNQESFARYAYFTTVEGNIVFANNDQIRGPVHSNDLIRIAASGATFFDTVSTAQSSINGQSNGTFMVPPRLSVPAIPLPTVQAFNALQVRAANAGMAFAGNTLGNGSGQATIRIEFVAIDLNGDLDSTDIDEGFVRIYQDNARPWYVVGSLVGSPGNDIRRSPNCGVPVNNANNSVVVGAPAQGANVRFRTVANANPNGGANFLATQMLSTNNALWRCYLGGDPRLNQTIWPSEALDAAAWAANVGNWAGGGAGWRPRPAGIGAPAVAAFTNRPDAAFLWPINRTYNPAWEGVIYVAGRVAVSGVVSGRVTLATPENIVIADDVRMAVDPGAPDAISCGNILGLFSGDSVVVADNAINTPQRINNAGNWRTYDATSEEDIHAVVLALDIFGAEDFDTGPSDAEDCGVSDAGRGCLGLTGGIIQRTRGAVGLTSGEGYIKRYQYNSCAASDPPPYFPTTGRFVRNRVYELNPTNFSAAAWFAANQNN